MSQKSKPCHCCDGSGEEIDQFALGRSLAIMRLGAGIGLREMARALGISHTYLFHLEAGTRRWPKEVQHHYRHKIERKKP